MYNLANYYCRQHFFNCSKSLDLTKLYHATKNSDAYLALPTKVLKQIIKCLTASRRGYFQAIKEWSKHPQRFLGKPKIPKYKDKTKAPNVVIYSKESVYKGPLKEGICHLSMSDIKIPVVVESVVEVRIVR